MTIFDQKILTADPTGDVAPVATDKPLGLPDPLLNPDAPLYDIGLDSGGSAYLFNRNWALYLADATTVFRTYLGLRMTFDLEKIQNGKMNQGKIAVYNLTDESRALFLKDKFLKFSVGYGNSLYPLFSNCSIFRVQHERKGPDFVSTFELMESGATLLTSTINTTYPAKTPALKIVQDLISAMGLVVGTIDSGFLNTKFNTGYTASGRCVDILAELVKNAGCVAPPPTGENVINIRGKSPTVQQPEIPLSEATGLLGVPNVALGQGGDNTLSFTALIDPRLAPGGVVRISSRFVQGKARILSAKYQGDTHESKWTVNCECAPLTPGSLTGINVSGA